MDLRNGLRANDLATRGVHRLERSVAVEFFIELSEASAPARWQ
jgi:hypothetical protein